MSRTRETIDSTPSETFDAAPRVSVPTVDITEWSELGARLASVDREKYEELLVAMRQIVEHQEMLASFDWQLLFGARPSSSKRYQA